METALTKTPSWSAAPAASALAAGGESPASTAERDGTGGAVADFLVVLALAHGWHPPARAIAPQSGASRGEGGEPGPSASRPTAGDDPSTTATSQAPRRDAPSRDLESAQSHRAAGRNTAISRGPLSSADGMQGATAPAALSPAAAPEDLAGQAAMAGGLSGAAGHRTPLKPERNTLTALEGSSRGGAGFLLDASVAGSPAAAGGNAAPSIVDSSAVDQGADDPPVTTTSHRPAAEAVVGSGAGHDSGIALEGEATSFHRPVMDASAASLAGAVPERLEGLSSGAIDAAWTRNPDDAGSAVGGGRHLRSGEPAGRQPANEVVLPSTPVKTAATLPHIAAGAGAEARPGQPAPTTFAAVGEAHAASAAGSDGVSVSHGGEPGISSAGTNAEGAERATRSAAAGVILSAGEPVTTPAGTGAAASFAWRIAAADVAAGDESAGEGLQGEKSPHLALETIESDLIDAAVSPEMSRSAGWAREMPLGDPGAGASSSHPGPASASTAVASRDEAVTSPHQPFVDLENLPSRLPQTIHLLSRGTTGEARIQLWPRHLGAISVRLEVDGPAVQVRIQAEREATRHLLEGMRTDLEAGLRSSGLRLHSLDVVRELSAMAAAEQALAGEAPETQVFGAGVAGAATRSMDGSSATLAPPPHGDFHPSTSGGGHGASSRSDPPSERGVPRERGTASRASAAAAPVPSDGTVDRWA